MVFSNFPEDPDLFAEDMKPLVKKIIELHGSQEWRAAVLTNEIHGHLGIYTIIGVKMGIKALEYLNVEAGDVQVESLAGVMPPNSCMNDGLQVSTGATFGHGLICSPPTNNPKAEAVFFAGNKKIWVSLNALQSAMIKEEIARAVKKFGNSEGYWQYVRELAVQYWYELDRNELFDIREL